MQPEGVGMSAYAGPTVAEVAAALDATRSDFIGLLERVDDPTPNAVGTWSVGETAAHAASSGAFFLGVVRGENEPEVLAEVAEHNAATLASDPERDPRVLARRFDEGERALLAHAAGVVGDPPVELFAGAVVPLSTVLGTELNELLVHGFDIARASRLPWEIDRRTAAVALSSVLPMLPHMVDPGRAAGLDARISLHVRGGDEAVLVFTGGALTLEASGPEPVDCHVSVDPAAYLLLAFQRVSPAGQALRGRILAWGRRPGLALRLPQLFIPV